MQVLPRKKLRYFGVCAPFQRHEGLLAQRMQRDGLQRSGGGKPDKAAVHAAIRNPGSNFDIVAEQQLVVNARIILMGLH